MRLRSLAVIAAALILSGCVSQSASTTSVPTDAASNQASDTRTVEMLPDRQIKIGEKISTPQMLVRDLKDTMGDQEPNQIRVLIKSSPAIPYEDFVVVLKILQDAGFVRIGLIK